MRAKRSSTAIGIQSRSGPSIAAKPPAAPAAKRVPVSAAVGVAHGLGLAHDARNLIGALGLYCDLLSRPGVLKPEHAHYAKELNLLGRRSATLLHRLMVALAAPGADSPIGLARPTSLREIAERCRGLLRSVAGGREIELSFGPAAYMPVMAAEDDVERILVNLVRNAAAALEAGSPALPHRQGRRPSSGRGKSKPRPISLLAGAHRIAKPIRITIGRVEGTTANCRTHPFLHTRLTVEDSGCGMDAQQLARLLNDGGRSPKPRGIGFRVVRELVAANGANLSVRSVPGGGTCVQIDWPAQIEWPTAASALSAAPRPEPAWPPTPGVSTESAQTSDSRWTA